MEKIYIYMCKVVINVFVDSKRETVCNSNVQRLRRSVSYHFRAVKKNSTTLRFTNNSRRIVLVSILQI